MFDFYICSKESNYLKLTKLNILIISIIVITILAYTTLASRNILKINKKTNMCFNFRIIRTIMDNKFISKVSFER